MSNSSEGQTYIQRYKVQGYPHLAIIDPRTGSLLWRKEGWTQVNPLTAEQFIEISTDFSSNHSFDTMPMAARNAYSSAIPMGASNDSDSKKRPIHELTEEEQLQAAIRASMAESAEGGDDDEVEVIDGSAEDDKKPSAVDDSTKAKEEEVEAEEEPGPSAFEQEILTMEVGDEPTAGDVARVQIKMPDGKRLVRKFAGDSPVKLIYAFVAQSNDDAKGGKAFELKAKFPPVDLFANIDDGIKSCGLNGEAIHVIWK
jgi:UBX domain-containing protein 7